jgi:hypothetical protein
LKPSAKGNRNVRSGHKGPKTKQRKRTRIRALRFLLGPCDRTKSNLGPFLLLHIRQINFQTRRRVLKFAVGKLPCVGEHFSRIFLFDCDHVCKHTFHYNIILRWYIIFSIETKRRVSQAVQRVSLSKFG